jgi:hypothetical protein
VKKIFFNKEWCLSEKISGGVVHDKKAPSDLVASGLKGLFCAVQVEQKPNRPLKFSQLLRRVKKFKLLRMDKYAATLNFFCFLSGTHFSRYYSGLRLY